jgi:hypothetical protein
MHKFLVVGLGGGGDNIFFTGTSEHVSASWRTHGPSFMEAKGGSGMQLYKWVSCAYVSICNDHPSVSYMNSIDNSVNWTLSCQVAVKLYNQSSFLACIFSVFLNCNLSHFLSIFHQLFSQRKK